jgi:hypothetical protein
MATSPDAFAAWLADAHIRDSRLTPEQRAVLQAAFCFRQRSGTDYYSTRLLSHFLLHCETGLKVAQLARLLGLSRPTASRQQALSAKQAIQQAHHRLDGRPYGKLLPRYAGPIAAFLFTHPEATRADLLDFISRVFAVRVSRVALTKFLKKFGLDEASRHAATAPRDPGAGPAPAGPASPVLTTPPPLPPLVPPGPALAPSLAPFFSRGRSMPGRS